ncbi:hypothetical protein GCM10022198_07600 [Klugiella xanthotipulae]|uniref:Cell division protein FtsL n=1 Tax=Klugiella xanthotipulae TaxID=244735 RepID=A0A543HT66_9MICO|nr:hypothetical protein [Klugiella xanthotipulae]TQM61480.1 hypothetical protein FB466_2434 [Klugiella xanthotipulae]
MSNNTVPLGNADLWPFDPATGTTSPITPSPRLSIALRPRTKVRTSMFYALMALGMLGVILAAQLLLSIAQADGAYQISSLELQERDLAREARAVTQDVDKLSSPQHLSENANTLGMVVNDRPAYLRLSDGAILGTVDAEASAPEPNRVPNSLIDGMPLAGTDASVETPQAESSPTEKAVPERATTSQDTRPVPWEGALPSPVTR